MTRVIDELYAVPPKEFSSARNATAASLKAAGHVKEAQAVRQLGKPSPFLWATNQLGRQDPEGVARFVDVVNRVRRSQLHDPRTAAEGMKTIRAELQALTNRAADVLIGVTNQQPDIVPRLGQARRRQRFQHVNDFGQLHRVSG